MTTFRKLWSIMVPAERASAVGLIALMVVGMALEMLSIGLVMPALAAMSAETSTVLPPGLQSLRGFAGVGSHTTVILLGLALLLTLYAFKSAFLLFSAWRQVSFVARLQDRIARTLFATYLCQPWTFHLQRNSATLIRNISEIPALAHTCMSMLATLTELMILTGILGLLLWLEPVGAIAVGLIMGAATWVLEKLTRRRLERWGRAFQEAAGLGYQDMMQGFGGVKELKLRGAEKVFIAEFGKHRSIQVAMQARQALFTMLPRLWYEFLAVSALCVLTGVMVWQGRSTQAMIPVLGLFAAAAFRILPSVNRLASGLQTLRYSTAVIDTVLEELALGLPPEMTRPSRPACFSKGLAVENVSYSYPGSDRPSLDDVSISVPHGASIGLVGGSGAGKSTLVDVILGLLVPTRGLVTVDGADIQANVGGWQRLVGYVPQAIFLCDDTIRRNVAFGVPEADIDERAIQRALAAAQLDQFVAGLPDGANTIIGERGARLSGGQRQRIGIARALYHDPDVLVLDEATSALDQDTEQGVMEAVEALHGTKTLIIVAHRLSTVAKCDTLYRLENGRLVRSGSFAEVAPVGTAGSARA